MAALRQGLRETGVEGRNVTIEGRFADDHYERSKAIGLTVPQDILTVADEVIE